MKGNDRMAKPSTVITKKDSKEGLIKSKGILRLDENGRIYIDTDDFGVMDIVAFIEELGMNGTEVEIKIQAKDELVDEVDPLAIYTIGLATSLTGWNSH